MSNDPRPEVLFPDHLAKPVHVEFDAESLTSDGGAPLLGVLNQGVGLTRLLGARLADRTPSGRREQLQDQAVQGRRPGDGVGAALRVPSARQLSLESAVAQRGLGGRRSTSLTHSSRMGLSGRPTGSGYVLRTSMGITVDSARSFYDPAR